MSDMTTCPFADIIPSHRPHPVFRQGRYLLCVGWPIVQWSGYGGQWDKVPASLAAQR